jgi:hypothetical protein
MRAIASWVLLGSLLAVSVPASAEDGSAAMRAYVDPVTGELVRKPVVPEQAVPSPEQSKSADGLVQEAAPGGGTMVHLRGRFQSPVTATLAPDGTSRVEHAH